MPKPGAEPRRDATGASWQTWKIHYRQTSWDKLLKYALPPFSACGPVGMGAAFRSPAAHWPASPTLLTLIRSMNNRARSVSRVRRVPHYSQRKIPGWPRPHRGFSSWVIYSVSGSPRAAGIACICCILEWHRADFRWNVRYHEELDHRELEASWRSIKATSNSGAEGTREVPTWEPALPIIPQLPSRRAKPAPFP
jgi:hypothetical protein